MAARRRGGGGRGAGARGGSVANRTIFTRDNLEVMRGMDSGVVDLIYLDPPFNKKKQFQAPIGSEAEGASFKDWWVMDDVKFEDMELLERKHPHITALIRASGAIGDRSNSPYLLYMAPRLIEMQRILRDTGSIYLHCDPAMSHYLKLLMDAIFGDGGPNNNRPGYRNEIVWHYSGWNKKMRTHFERRHDILFYYSKAVRPSFNSYATPWESEAEYIKTRRQKVHEDKKGKYVLSDAGSGKRIKRYLSEALTYGKPVSDVWEIDKLNNSAKESIGYPTQKPLALLERIIQASSNPGDMVLDPFCGCATTCVAAEKLGRQWIGIDVSPKAAELVKSRVEREIGKLFQPIHRRDVPIRREKLVRSADGTLLTRLYGEQGGNCNICGVLFPKRNLTLDHIVPLSKGGPDADDNIQLLCQACNSMKGKRSQAWAMQHYEKHWRVS